MFLENQVIGDDFVKVKDWANQSDGIPTNLENSELSTDNLTYGLTRIVKALSKSIFGKTNPGNKTEIIIPDGTAPNIKELISRITTLEAKMAGIEATVTTILTGVNKLVNILTPELDDVGSTLKKVIEQLSTNNKTWFDNSTNVIKSQVETTINSLKTDASSDSLIGKIEGKVNDVVKKAVIFITGNTGYPYTGGGN